MMYSEPGFEKGFEEIKNSGFAKIIVCPLYPQYAESSTRSSIEKFDRYYKASGLKAELIYIKPFYKEDFFINSFASHIVAKQPDYQKFDHIVFSYHGLPQSHIEKSGLSDNYRQQCLETTELLAAKLELNKNNYVTCFQSRVGVTKWITPYLDKTCEDLAQRGLKNLLLVSPSFVVDGLETLQEIGDLEKSLRLKFDVHLHLVSALNSESLWIKNFAEYIKKCSN